MIERDVVHDRDARLKKRNRPVALVHFADEHLAFADPGAGERGVRGDEVLHVRAVHDRRALSGAMQNPADHADGGGLAAGAGDANAQGGSVEEFGEKPRARGDGGADAARGLHVGDRFLDRGGGDQDLTGAADAAAILRMEQHAACAQEIESFGIASLVERAVGALDPSAPGLDDQSERGHAATADAAKKVISRLRTSAKSTSVADEVQRARGAGMSKEKCRIGVVAPASRMSADVAERVQALAGTLYPERAPEIFFHPQCFASHGHFAGDDATRAQAFLDIANDESYDAVWFARGGYGSCRVVEAVMCGLTRAGQAKNLSRLQRCRHAAGGACTGPGSSPWRTVRWRRTSCGTEATQRSRGRSPG